jgi:hypothetical protein
MEVKLIHIRLGIVILYSEIITSFILMGGRAFMQLFTYAGIYAWKRLKRRMVGVFSCEHPKKNEGREPLVNSR